MSPIRQLNEFMGSTARAARRRVAVFFGGEKPVFTPFSEGAIRDHLTNIKWLRRKFDPAKAGRTDAISGLKSDGHSTFEYSAAIAFQKETDHLRTRAERELLELDRDVKQRLRTGPEIHSERIMARLETVQESVLRSWRERLVDSRCQALQSKRRINAFRQANPPVQLRPVHYRNGIVALVGVVAVMALEALLNYTLLMTTGGSKPIQIFALVFMTASINLILGLLGVGFTGARNLGHIRLGRKFFGLMILVFSACGIVLLNFALAHYRNALDMVKADPTAVASAGIMLQRLAAIPVSIGHTMRTDPFAFLGDLQAIVVFLMGIGFAAVASAEGYWLLADPYPGYESAHRVYKAALDTAEHERRCFEEEIANTVLDTKAELENIIFEGQQRLNAVKRYLDAAVEVTRRYEEGASEIEHTMLRIIDEYRSEYRVVRENPGPPQWQDEEPRLNREATFGLENLVQIEERESADLACLRRTASDLNMRLTMCQTTLIERVKNYLDTVEQDAQREEDTARADLFGVRTPSPPAMV